MNSDNPTDKLIQSLKELLEWYKYTATLDEMDFGMIHSICRLIDDIDPEKRARRKKEKLKNTIILNPGGKQGNIIFFIDPEDL